MNRMTTGMRPPGSRMQTGLKDAQFQSVGMAQNMKFVNRPVTNSGMSGMQFKQKNEDRQIVDRSFVIQQLREKCTNIYQEIESFKKKMDNLGKDNTLYQNLDKKFEDLTKEVRELEGKLADYNLAFDKQRAGTRAEEIRNMYEHIKIQNDRYRQQLDEIFIERKNQEEQIQTIETQLTEFNDMAQQKINDLLPEQRDEYLSLINENKELGGQIQNSRQELDDINQKLIYCENRLRMDSHKLKGQLLKEQITELDRKREDLELQVNEANLPFDQARDRLLARIKEDNAFIQQTDKRVREIKKNIDNYEKRKRELDNEQNNEKSAEEQKQKYEPVFLKDKQFNEFFADYDNLRNADLEQLNTIENNIQNLLETSSKMLAQAGALPSAQEYKNYQGDMKIEGGDSLESQKMEYKSKQEALNKLHEAEDRVANEQRQLDEKINSMKKDIREKYNRADQIKRELDNKRSDLIKNRDNLKHKKTTLYEDWRKMTYEHDLKEKKMTMKEMYGSYTEAENKYLSLEKDMENLKQYIQNKAGDMDYQALSEECKIMADQLNKLIVKNM